MLENLQVAWLGLNVRRNILLHYMNIILYRRNNIMLKYYNVYTIHTCFSCFVRDNEKRIQRRYTEMHACRQQ